MSKPKIFVFSGVLDGGEGPCFAMAEDGHVLGSHWCSHEEWAKHDLGVNEGSRPDRHETYAKHYPDGYEMEFVPRADVPTHAEFQDAWENNQMLEIEEDEGDDHGSDEGEA